MSWRRLFGFRRRAALEARLREEMDFHLREATEQNLRAGLPPDEARRQALIAFGGRDQWSEATRDEIRSRPLEELLRDVRYAFRSLRRAPGLTAAAVTTLALTIGATTAIFSVVNAVLLRRLPYPDAERIVAVCEQSTLRPASTLCPIGGFSGANYLIWREQARSFDAMGAFYERRVAITSPGLEPVSAQIRIANARVFSVLGARASLGRLYTEADDQPGAPAVLVLDHAFWQQHWGGDSSVIGRQVRLNGVDATLIGVTQPGFALYEPVDAWLPVRFSAEQRNRGGRFLRVVALLKPGVTLEQANRELGLLAARRAQDAPEFNTGMTAFAMPLREKLLGRSGPVLWTLFGAVGFLLLIACANVANLMLARAAARERELAVRVSLGASRARLVRQLLTESVVLSLGSAVLGLALAVQGTHALVALVPEGISTQSLAGVAVNWRLLGFTALVALGTGLLFGVVPALHAGRGDVQETLKEGGRAGSSASRKSARFRSALVVAEVSLALVLLTGAGLMVRSFAALQGVRLGFEPAAALTARLTLPGRKYPNDTVITGTFRQLEAQIGALPGVQAVGAISYLPLTGERSVNGFTVEGRPAPKQGDEPSGDMRSVTPGYFQAMGIPIREGRGFTADDGIERPAVAVVSETLARTLFPGERAVGHFLRYDWDTPQRVEIVGVAGDVHHDGPDKATYMEVYRPHPQFAYSSMTLVIRVAGDPSSYGNLLRGAVRAVDGDLPLAAVQPMAALVTRSIGPARLSTALFGLFGGLALVLAAVGIYGVMSYTVQQRRQEFGIRLALGASPRAIVALVTRRGAALSGAGIAIGTVAALAGAGLMRNLLFGIPPHDLATFVATVLILSGVGVLAAWLPGRRATRVDPVSALREEGRAAK